MLISALFALFINGSALTLQIRLWQPRNHVNFVLFFLTSRLLVQAIDIAQAAVRNAKQT